MVPYNFTEFIDDLTFQVKNNIIPISRIDDAVARILRVKFTMGLFENPLADLSLTNQLGSKVHFLMNAILTCAEYFMHFEFVLLIAYHVLNRNIES